MLIANKNQMHIPTLMAKENGEWGRLVFLKMDYQETEIINESIRLFEKSFKEFKLE